MAFFNTAHELTRRCEQNKNDIEEIYKQGKKTDANVERLATEVVNLTTRVGNVETKVDNLTTRVDNVETKVDNLTTRVDNVETKVDNLTTRVGERFNRLERILTQAPRVDPSSPLDFLPPEHEQSLRLLESKMKPLQPPHPGPQRGTRAPQATGRRPRRPVRHARRADGRGARDPARQVRVTGQVQKTAIPTFTTTSPTSDGGNHFGAGTRRITYTRASTPITSRISVLMPSFIPL